MVILSSCLFRTHGLGPHRKADSVVSSEMNKVGNPSPPRFRFGLENCLLWITTQQQQATVTPAVIGWHFKNALSSKSFEIKISVQSIQKKEILEIICKLLNIEGAASHRRNLVLGRENKTNYPV